MGEAVGGGAEATVSASTRLGPDAIRHWAYLCVDGLNDRCDEMNDLNVFPIPDSDTGTNLVFTVRAAVESMRAAGPDADLAHLTAALAHGATAGARGNSGVIVSQVMRALAEECREGGGSVGGQLDGRAVQHLLRRAADLVVEVISVPVEGTIVTVLQKAAEAAASANEPADLPAVVTRSAGAAAEALDRTRAQLPVLDAAGVVDAGGLGLLVMLDALSHVVTGRVSSRVRYHRAVVPTRVSRPSTRARTTGEAERADPGRVVGYEVVYRVTEIDESGVVELRRVLSDLGDSVVVAGDGAGTWSAHVHTTTAGEAVDAGLLIGRLRDVRIHAFIADDDCTSRNVDEACGQAAEVQPGGRDILAVVAGAEAEALYRAEGAVVLRCDPTPIGTAELCAAIVESEHHEVLVLPNGALSAHELVSVSIASRTAGKDVLMLPSSSMVQGLAALAVHDSTRAALDDAFAMSEAAAATRWASVRAATERSLTWVGMCEPGDGLGLVGREVVVIGPNVFAAGCALLDQLLSVGGEMVTMLRGAEGPDVTGRLTQYLADRHPAVEVVVYDSGQPGDAVQLGVE